MKASPVNLVFRNEAFADHEQVVFCRDVDSGLRAIIAIHDTTLGPALGGTAWPRRARENKARCCMPT